MPTSLWNTHVFIVYSFFSKDGTMSSISKDTAPSNIIITQNEAMLSVIEDVKSAAAARKPLFITGESGTGKELMVDYIYEIGGFRGGLAKINVMDLNDEDLFPATLFGYTRGAFARSEESHGGLIEKASGGVLFLDEISALNPASQIRIYKLLQSGEYIPLGKDKPSHTDAYIVFASSADLWVLQRSGRFRWDLNLKLREHHVHLPPLRDRIDDIPLLTDYFFEESARILEKKRPTPPKELYTLLKTYSFPGNVSELRRMVFEAVREHKSKILSLDVFKAHMSRKKAEKPYREELDVDDDAPFKSFRKLPTIKKVTHMLVEEAMRRSGGNQSIAARMLGISQPALSKRLKNAAKKRK
jgi:DNA-binding NtrC family response regulator